MENQFGVLDSLAVTVLLEDYAGYDSNLLSQHGISFLLEARYKDRLFTILFDCGQSAPPVLHNMKTLGKDPGKIDMVFLSHCHYDHTGGLVGILEASGQQRVPVIAHPAIHRSTYSLKPSLHSVGMGPGSNREEIEKAGGELVLASDPLPLFPGIFSTGEIKEQVVFEKVPTLSLATIEDGKIVPDMMIDDMSLVIALQHELVIITGCSHAGIISIIETAITLTGIDHIAAILGGFHLVDADEDRINKTLQDLSLIKAAKIYTGHCTGLKAEAKMLQGLSKRFEKLHTGMKIKF